MNDEVCRIVHAHMNGLIVIVMFCCFTDIFFIIFIIFFIIFALALRSPWRAHEILILFKTQLCKLIRYSTRNGSITYTNSIIIHGFMTRICEMRQKTD